MNVVGGRSIAGLGGMAALTVLSLGSCTSPPPLAGEDLLAALAFDRAVHSWKRPLKRPRA